MRTASRTLALALAEAGAAAPQVLDDAGHPAAAAAIRGGRPVGEVAATVLPAPLAAPFEVGAPEIVRPLVEAGLRLHDRVARVRRTVRAALASSALALGTMVAATIFVLPSVLAQLMTCGMEVPFALQLGIRVFEVVAAPAFGVIFGVLLVLGWLRADAIWLRLPAGRRAQAALAAEQLAHLIEAGAELPAALRQVGRGLTHDHLADAATAIEGGAPLAASLARAGLLDAAYGGLLEVPGHDALGAVLAAQAAALRADQAATAPHAGRAFWWIYAGAIGGLAVLFALMIMTSCVAVLECLG